MECENMIISLNIRSFYLLNNSSAYFSVMFIDSSNMKLKKDNLHGALSDDHNFN